MRVYWERIGVLWPIYRLVGQGCNDQEIASRLNITEVKVHGCIDWLLKFLNMSDRLDLVRHALTTEPPVRQVVQGEPEYLPVVTGGRLKDRELLVWTGLQSNKVPQ